MSILAAIPVLLVLGLMLSLPLVLGVYVYRDAKRRRMNAPLWALVAALAPAMLGVIVYLLVRGNHADLRCPRCDAPVKEQFILCPKCGTRLRATCPNCSTMVESDWRVCPRCTASLTGVQQTVQPPVTAKDGAVWKVLVVVLVIPVLLIGILVTSLTVYHSGGSSSFWEATIDEYMEDMRTEGTEAEIAIAGQVETWLEGLNPEPGNAYALRYDHATESGNESFFLVYVPGAGGQISSGMGQSSSIFGTTLTLELHGTGGEGSLFNITTSADEAPKLKVLLDGKKIPCEVTVVAFNPTLFFLEPSDS